MEKAREMLIFTDNRPANMDHIRKSASGCLALLLLGGIRPRALIYKKGSTCYAFFTSQLQLSAVKVAPVHLYWSSATALTAVSGRERPEERSGARGLITRH
jgi:hypothetical protein